MITYFYKWLRNYRKRDIERRTIRPLKDFNRLLPTVSPIRWKICQHISHHENSCTHVKEERRVEKKGRGEKLACENLTDRGERNGRIAWQSHENIRPCLSAISIDRWVGNKIAMNVFHRKPWNFRCNFTVQFYFVKGRN